ncbi:MAG TPA: hypothetical protein VNM92_11850 [Thermoanaerobaculia bacterium]|nr:hypothetical protein [Thermoanaerobaculia bacterium]
MDIDYQSLGHELTDGTFESRLERELTEGFRLLADAGNPLPLPSYYATKIAEIIHAGLPVALTKDAEWELYQSIVAACEKAWENVTGTPRKGA